MPPKKVGEKAAPKAFPKKVPVNKVTDGAPKASAKTPTAEKSNANKAAVPSAAATAVGDGVVPTKVRRLKKVRTTVMRKKLPREDRPEFQDFGRSGYNKWGIHCLDDNWEETLADMSSSSSEEEVETEIEVEVSSDDDGSVSPHSSIEMRKGALMQRVRKVVRRKKLPREDRRGVSLLDSHLGG